MLHLARGAAMDYILSHLEHLGYSWAFRVVDSRAFGLPQRRRRVYIVASLAGDPRDVLLADDVPDRSWPSARHGPADRLLLDGRPHGSRPDGGCHAPRSRPVLAWVSRRPRGCFCPPDVSSRPPSKPWNACRAFRRSGLRALRGTKGGRKRWQLVGNAVSVPVAEWIGHRLSAPSMYDGVKDRPFVQGEPWPRARVVHGQEPNGGKRLGVPS